MLHKWNLFAVRIRFALPLLNVDIILFATYTAKSATDLIQIVCISGLMQVANKLYQPVDFIKLNRVFSLRVFSSV